MVQCIKIRHTLDILCYVSIYYITYPAQLNPQVTVILNVWKGESSTYLQDDRPTELLKLNYYFQETMKKNLIKINQDFLCKYILNYIIHY
jgi:hypothetical protein